MASAPPFGQANLVALPPHLINDTGLTSHIASRYHAQHPTSYLSSQGIVAINTYTSSTRGPNGGKEGSGMGAMEELAERIWSRLGHRQENQAVCYLGESGSGKTTLRSHLLAAMLQFSSTPLSKKLSFAAFVFDTLTTTKSVTTSTASKSGLFFELQYDTATTLHPTLIGGKILDHRLERSRVTSVPPGERNFHILYYLLAGTSPAEKEHLGLDVATHFNSTTGKRSSVIAGQKRWRYLGHPSQMKVGVDDSQGFQHFKTALRKLEFPREQIAHMCEVLAAILHIGQLEFTTTQATTPAPDESGGYGQEGGEEVTVVVNKDVLAIVAAFLGVPERDLEISLGYRTKTLGRERVTIMLDAKGARDNADELARTLYSLLVALIMERINERLCASEESIGNTVSIVDFPGFAQTTPTGSTLDQLLNNAATESLYNFTLHSFFEGKADLLETEEVQVPATSYFDNVDTVKGLLKPGNGLLSILDDQMKRGKSDAQFLESLRKRFENKNPAIEVGSSTAVMPGSNFATYNSAAAFTVKHFAGEVEYPIEGLLEANAEVISGDLMNLMGASTSEFVTSLFGQQALNRVTHPQDKTAVMQASVASKPSRMPSMSRRKFAGVSRKAHDDNDEGTRSFTRTKNNSDAQQGAAGQFMVSLDNITKSLQAHNVNPYFVFCIKPNDRRIANQFDSKCVRTQIQTFGIAEISQRLRNADFTIFMPINEFLGSAEGDVSIVGNDREKAEAIIEDKSWPVNEARIGATGVFLSERCWRQIARATDIGEAPSRNNDTPYSETGPDSKRPFASSKVALLTPQGHYLDDKAAGYFGSRDMDTKSEAGASAFREGDMFHNLETREELAEKGNDLNATPIEKRPMSGSRRRWLVIVYALTWFVPDILIRWIGGMKRADVRMAWREKLAINFIIWLSCALLVFVMIGLPVLICPTQHVYSLSELSSNDGKNGHSAFTAVKGIVIDLGSFAPRHYPSVVPQSALLKYAGLDSTNLFPVQVSAMCAGVNGFIDDAVQMHFQNYNQSTAAQLGAPDDANSKYHDFRAATNDSQPGWLLEQMITLQGQYYKGRVGYSMEYLSTLASQSRQIAAINGRVYDLTPYNGRTTQYASGVNPPSTKPDVNFMYQDLVNIFQQGSGGDVTQFYNNLGWSSGLKSNMTTCLNNLFYVGDVDTRNSPKCQFATYLLLAISLLLVTVICFKFLAALQFSKKTIPENLDKFLICTVPAYTEDEDSLRRAIDSAARMRYDDKRKLLFIVCDGMIIGQGNDRPTPRIVLDILGVPDTVDPEPLSFESLGEGSRQHNMGKVYSGLYEVQGHIVPFIVLVKVGKPSEVSKPGNRGKRDSQMVLMRFLNRVHYNLPMSSLELELYHQIRNVIGVNPAFYEFLLQIDADTVVAPDSATRMIAACLHDTRLIGVCGETSLSNAKASFITMMQVYEYFISHNMTKAFESLFGTVTCLPGCFSMYRIRAADTGKPLFVSKEIIDDYSETRVDTLHLKNLLHLGEDRYLTTLLLKHHSKYKTKYIMRAHAFTIAPDNWSIFMSQRRRWINSTVHNLIELVPLQQLCGFCCFSMRFIVLIDLLSTIVQPVIVGYIVYLIVEVARSPSLVPITAFILLGAIYGLQAVVFIIRRRWDMIAWMLIYILATPVFSFALPLYAFWHMNDFSWGNTRVVTGDNGKEQLVSDEGRFDPDSIPKKKWEDYHAELQDAYTMRGMDDTHSEVSGYSYATKQYPAASVHEFIPAGTQSRPLSHVQGMAPMQHPMMGYHNPSHMSLVMSENGQFLPRAQSMVLADGELMDLNLPTDDAILAEIREILRNADLMTVTKKSIKAELERRFGVSLDVKKQYIGSATEAILSGQL